MSIEQIENEALKLDPKARAELAEKLLKSLEDLSEEQIMQLWAEEAVRRDAELDSGVASMRDAEDVFKDARARISCPVVSAMPPDVRRGYASPSL